LGTFNLDFEPGPAAAITLGYDLNPRGLLGDGRLELEFARRSNALEKVDFLEGKVDGDGDLRAESLLLNTWGVYRGLRDWVPYFGAGFGAARVTADDLQVFGQPLADDDKVVFAYQLGIGADIPLTPSLSLDLGYRFFGTARPEFTAADGSKFKTRYLSHSALLGLRLGF
jgi:opacity protein-like surface antigen